MPESLHSNLSKMFHSTDHGEVSLVIDSDHYGNISFKLDREYHNYSQVSTCIHISNNHSVEVIDKMISSLQEAKQKIEEQKQKQKQEEETPTTSHEKSRIKEGDGGKAICFHCKDIMPITYLYRDVPFSDGSGMVRNILVGVCNCCDSVISTPSQSTPAIKEELQKQKK